MEIGGSKFLKRAGNGTRTRDPLLATQRGKAVMRHE